MTPRQQTWQALRAHPDVDVLVVGGGVNGIGTFRELALNGVRVLLAERSDYCAGSSAASSHMVHGGLRYLENGEFRLVREALLERNRLLRNAPHSVFPLPTTIPIFRRWSGFLNAPLKFVGLTNKPAERGTAVIRLGLLTYDLFAAIERALPTHSFMGRAAALERFPGLNPDVRAAATYYDAWMPMPERICLELVQDALAAGPHAQALNYAEVVGGDGAGGVTLRDALSGDTHTVRPRVVINAAGPWIDFANAALGRPTRAIGGTKGSHLVVDHPALHAALRGHEIFFENADGRICLIFPLEDRVLIGTTDIHTDAPDEAVTTDAEIDYLLGLVDRVFPALAVGREHIVYTFSGVRPLPASDAASAGQISRDHSIVTHAPGDGVPFPVLSLVGGKWTTWRAFSAQAADAALQHLGRTRDVHTHNRAFGGGLGYPQDATTRATWVQTLARDTGHPLPLVQAWFARYGTHASQLARAVDAASDVPLPGRSDITAGEIAHLAAHEHVAHLDDLLMRRTLLAMLGRLTLPLLHAVAEAAAPVLSWGAARREEEVQRALGLLHTRQRVSVHVQQPPTLAAADAPSPERAPA